jgi:hypothetical protein
MQLIDITVFKNADHYFLPQFQTIIKPSNKTVSFLTKLLKDPYFQKKTVELRKKHKIPKNGYDAKLLLKFKHPTVTYSISKYNGIYDIEPLKKKMEDDINELVKYYNVHTAYIYYFFLLITHNSFIEVEQKDTIGIQFHELDKNSGNLIEAFKRPVGGILIYSDITKTQLKTWIDENWDTDLMWQSFRQKQPKIPNENGTYKNALLDIEIAELKSKGTNYEEIANTFSLKYPGNENASDVGWLKMRFSRYKNKKLK